MSISMRRAMSAAIFSVSIISTTAAYAEEYVTVNPLSVERSTLTVPSLYEIERQIRHVPGGADVVPAEKYKDGYALSVADVLKETPGVFAQQRWGEESRLSIRGSGLSRGFHLRGVRLLQDGIPISFADGSGDFQEIDPLMHQHVEVYRGGNGLRYGAASLGGAVNFVTPSARSVDYNWLARTEAGSYGTLRIHGQAAQVYKGFDVLAAMTRTRSDGFRKQSQQDNVRFNGNVGAKLTPNIETRFYLNYNDIHQEVPGTISKEDALERPKTVPAVNVLNRYARDIHSWRLANRTVLTLDNGLEVEIGAYANDKKLYHPIFQIIDQNSLDLGAFTRVKGNWMLADRQNETVVGLNFGHGRNDADRYVNISGQRGAQTANATQRVKNLEIYGENRFYVRPDFSLIAGFQGSFSDRDYTDHFNAANNDDTLFRSFNPKVGALWNITPYSEIYAGVTKSSEPPTFSELVQGAIPGFVPVDLQTAWTAEIGTRGDYGHFSWDATAYRAWVRDELLQFTVTPDVPASTFNAPRTIHQGLELGGSWRALDWLTLRGVYNLNDFYFENDSQFGDNTLAGAPPHQLQFSLRYEDHGVFVEPDVAWIPEAAWVDYANTSKADTYAVLGIKAGWHITDKATLFFDARNLTDEGYVSSFSTVTDARTAGTNVFYPGDGRGFYGGLNLKF